MRFRREQKVALEALHRQPPEGSSVRASHLVVQQTPRKLPLQLRQLRQPPRSRPVAAADLHPRRHHLQSGIQRPAMRSSSVAR